MYRKGEGVPKDNNVAARWFKLGGEQGDAYSQYSLAFMYLEGTGVKKDYKEAIKWFKKAANRGDAKAQRALGMMYETGTGFTQDYKEAVKWYRKAASQGDALATKYLKEIEKDKESFEFCLVKAKQGDAEFQTTLATYYQDGEGVERNYKEAIKWYKKAADQGNRLAANKVSMMYYGGKGVDKDYEIASMLLEKYFQDASADEQYHLGQKFRQGMMYPKDLNEAYKWYKKAAEQGYQPAKDQVEKLCGTSPEACK